LPHFPAGNLRPCFLFFFTTSSSSSQLWDGDGGRDGTGYPRIANVDEMPSFVLN